jgi:DnaJ like chaperone protein
MAWVKNLIKEATESTDTLDAMLEEFKRTFAYEPRLILLELILPDSLHQGSRWLRTSCRKPAQIAVFLEISQYDLRTIEAKYTYQRQRQTSQRHVSTMTLTITPCLDLEPGANMARRSKNPIGSSA